MVYKQYVNYDYRILVKTQLFITMDMYVMKFSVNNGDLFYNNLSADLFSNDQDIDLMRYWHNPIIMTDVVMGVDQKTEKKIHVGKKNYNEINIISHDNLYKMTIEDNILDVFIVWLKRFDKDNYIAPVAIRVDREYLIKTGNVLDLSNLIQERENVKEIGKLINNFKKAIFV